VDHREGRRARYIAPPRLYLLASLVFFAAVALAPIQLVRVSLTGQSSGSPGNVLTGAVVDIQADEGDGALADLVARGAEDPERLNDLFVNSMAWSMFLLIPLFAGMLALLFRRSRLLYVQHLVFALHYHAFGFLTQAVGYAGMHLPIEGAAAPLVLAPQAINAVYLYLAFRRYYGFRPLATLVRMGVLGFFYVIAVGFVMLATAAVALLLL
jgi:hypothetical protein